jgi:uncharacterized membrane protein YeaQ/YmgE (transglycosylase-associated protein family)
MLIIGSICFVFVGSFVATLFVPNYSGAAIFAPVMASVGGAAVGVALSRRNGNGNGNGARK